jgi:hypothetical protein
MELHRRRDKWFSSEGIKPRTWQVTLMSNGWFSKNNNYSSLWLPYYCCYCWKHGHRYNLYKQFVSQIRNRRWSRKMFVEHDKKCQSHTEGGFRIYNLENQEHQRASDPGLLMNNTDSLPIYLKENRRYPQCAICACNHTQANTNDRYLWLCYCCDGVRLCVCGTGPLTSTLSGPQVTIWSSGGMTGGKPKNSEKRLSECHFVH